MNIGQFLFSCRSIRKSQSYLLRALYGQNEREGEANHGQWDTTVCWCSKHGNCWCSVHPNNHQGLAVLPWAAMAAGTWALLLSRPLSGCGSRRAALWFITIEMPGNLPSVPQFILCEIWPRVQSNTFCSEWICFHITNGDLQDLLEGRKLYLSVLISLDIKLSVSPISCITFFY